MRRLLSCLAGLVWFCLPTASAQEIPPSLLDSAATAYRQGAYLQAAEALGRTPGLLAIVPFLDQGSARMRARIFFDVGRCHMAVGDTAMASQVLRHVFALDVEASDGVLLLSQDRAIEEARAYLKQLRRMKHQVEIGATSPWKAAARSALLPGWGQIYRGHTRKGKVLMGAAAVLTVAWAVADRSYRSGVVSYRSTSVADLNLFERKGTPEDPRPFDARFGRAVSRARIANAVVGTLASVWAFGVLDNLFFGPGKIGFEVSLDRSPGRHETAAFLPSGRWRTYHGQR